MLRFNHQLLPGLLSIAVTASGFASPTGCGLPLAPLNVSQPNYVIGNGTPSSCYEGALTAALNVGGIIVFNCGAAPLTIPITQQHEFRNDVNTVLDGGNLITLQGNGTTRLFVARSGDGPWYGGTPPYYMSTRTSITIQNITMSGGRSSGTPIPPAPSPCSQGTDLDGGGGAIYVRDMVLHVINSTFTNNHGAAVGPDVAGGAIYALGSLDLTIQGSQFLNNDGSNGGAVGTLDTDLTAVNDVYSGNRALGHDNNQNVPASGCPIRYNQNQIGSGGSAGALYMDGLASSRGMIICGNQFLGNQGGVNGLGGALAVLGDPGVLPLVLVQSEFDNNQNTYGGAIFGFVSQLIAVGVTFNNNRGTYGGAIFTDQTQIIAVNDTFANNSASTSIGAVAAFSGSSGVFLNDTFSGNTAPYFPITFPGDANTPTPNLVFVNDIFSGNVGTSGYNLPCHATLPGANNVLWPYSPLSPAPEGGCAGGQILLNPQLAPLADNGGGLLTMALPAGNPAKNVGATNCPATDARGVARPAVCAAGAYQP